jgi:hypothetical protein
VVSFGRGESASVAVVSYHPTATKNASFTNGHLLGSVQMAICLAAYTRFLRGGVFKKMPQNGEKNTTFGVYRSLCCGFEVVIAAGAKFPDCPNHPKLKTQWQPVHDEAIHRASDLPRARKKNNDSAA